MWKTGDPARASGSDGFTLLELLVVIAILALVGGLMFPRVDRILDGVRFESARSVVLAAARGARAEALRTDTMVLLDASSDGHALLSNGRVVARFPPPLSLVGQPGGARFFGDGSATSGAFRLAGQGRRAELHILSPAGMTQWQR